MKPSNNQYGIIGIIGIAILALVPLFFFNNQTEVEVSDASIINFVTSNAAFIPSGKVENIKVIQTQVETDKYLFPLNVAIFCGNWQKTPQASSMAVTISFLIHSELQLKQVIKEKYFLDTENLYQLDNKYKAFNLYNLKSRITGQHSAKHCESVLDKTISDALHF